MLGSTVRIPPALPVILSISTLGPIKSRPINPSAWLAAFGTMSQHALELGTKMTYSLASYEKLHNNQHGILGGIITHRTGRILQMTEARCYPWYVMRTRSRQEKVVANCLRTKKITVFLPQQDIVRRTNGRRRVVNCPLFPGYIFVQPLPEQFPCLRFIPGSCGLIFTGREPAQMPEKDLEAVRVIVDSDVPLSVFEELIPGRKIEVLSGPLKGIRGELVRVMNECRLVINAHLLNKSVCVEIGSHDIQAL